MFANKETPAPRDSFFKRLRARLNKGDSWLTYDLANLAPGGKIDAAGSPTIWPISLRAAK
jgi:hypothetical protein